MTISTSTNSRNLNQIKILMIDKIKDKLKCK